MLLWLSSHNPHMVGKHLFPVLAAFAFAATPPISAQHPTFPPPKPEPVAVI